MHSRTHQTLADESAFLNQQARDMQVGRYLLTLLHLWQKHDGGHDADGDGGDVSVSVSVRAKLAEQILEFGKKFKYYSSFCPLNERIVMIARLQSFLKTTSTSTTISSSSSSRDRDNSDGHLDVLFAVRAALHSILVDMGERAGTTPRVHHLIPMLCHCVALI